MPIALSQLLIFNNVESTDPIVGAVQTPFFKQPTYIAGQTFVNGYEKFIKGQNGFGSQVLVRKLGKGTATKVKATAANALKFTHAETADTLITIPLDDIVKQSEEVYEFVEVARGSKTGAMKAEVVVKNIGETVQSTISAYLQASAVLSDDVAAVSISDIKDQIITDMEKLDYKPNTLVVSLAVQTLLLQLITTGDFLSYNGFDAIKTGAIGRFLGMEVFYDPNLDSKVDYVMYDYEKFAVFAVLESFDLVPAIDFKGSYVRGMVLLGNETNLATFAAVTKGNGSWAVKHTNAA